MVGAANIDEKFKTRALADLTAAGDPQDERERALIIEYIDTVMMSEFEEQHKRSFQGPGITASLYIRLWGFKSSHEHPNISYEVYSLNQ